MSYETPYLLYRFHVEYTFNNVCFNVKLFRNKIGNGRFKNIKRTETNQKEL